MPHFKSIEELALRGNLCWNIRDIVPQYISPESFKFAAQSHSFAHGSPDTGI